MVTETLTGSRRLCVDRTSREQVVMVAGRQGGVQFRSCSGRGAGETRSERGWREVGASTSTRPRRICCRVRISPRVMWRELAHVCG